MDYLNYEKLKQLGATEVEQEEDAIYFKIDGYSYAVQEDDISNNHTISDMLNSADLFCSYCGNEANKDTHFCKQCKEHF